MAKRVYFAFHYQDVIDFRANVVRNHNLVGGVQAAGYFDHSIWESAKKTDPAALKRLINSELKGASMTVVLIGSDTWQRRWVRYEIFKSAECGKALLGVHINGITGKDQKTKQPGPNPFDNLGLEISEDGKMASPTEWVNKKWAYYKDLEPFAVAQQPAALRGKHFTLTKWCRVYDWIVDDGYTNFSSWLSSISPDNA